MQIGSKFTIGVHIITAIDYFKDMDRVNSEFSHHHGHRLLQGYGSCEQ